MSKETNFSKIGDTDEMKVSKKNWGNPKVCTKKLKKIFIS